jgi:D-glycero-D-manno-heptose 1,7-bisphosphate phosphatase
MMAPPPPCPYDHLLVDRDGVLNREHDGWVTDVASWEWEHNAVEGLTAVGRLGITVSVVTNQSCIGRGVATEEEVDRLHAWLAVELRGLGVEVAGVHVCPHAPRDACGCRKPAPGLVRSAIASRPVPARRCLVLGDDTRDIEAGRSAGTAMALVRTGKGTSAVHPPDVPRFDDLLHFADWLGSGAPMGRAVP